MMYVVFITFLFFASLFFQTTVITAFGLPISATPFHLAIAFLLLHRGRLELGSVWIALTPITALWIGFLPGSWWAYLLTALCAPILVTRIFAKRSLLALVGLSFSLYGIFVVSSLFHTTQSASGLISGFLMLFITLLILSYLERYLKRLSTRFVFIRHTR